VNHLNARVSLVAAVAVALGAVAGSASALLRIGTDAGMSVPWSLPVGLDAVAIVAATAVRRHRTDRLAWATLLVATGLSTWLQVLAAPDGLVNRMAHAVPPVAVLVSFELFLRATGTPETTETTGPVPDPSGDHLAVLVGSNGLGPVPAGTALVPVSAPTGTGATTPVPVVETTVAAVETNDDLVALAETVAAELVRQGRSLSRRSLMDGLRAAGRPVGTNRAAQLLAYLKTRPHLVEATS
jgi:uncharacterized membrane protein (UPF0136 family)